MSATVRYRKPVELRRLGRRHAMVEASAGTGKTYILEHLVVDLLLRTGATLDQILVVTFTEKATSELTHRVRHKLAELCDLHAGDANAVKDGNHDGDRESSDEGSNEGNDEGNDDCWHLDDAARDRLRRALLGFDRANILTIHAFCQRILTENAFIQGRLFDEETVDEREAFRAAFVETLRKEVAPCSGEVTLIEAWRRAGNTLERLEAQLFEAHRKLSCIYPLRAGVLRPAAGFDARRLVAAVAGWPAFGAADDDESQVRQRFKQNKVHHSTAAAWVRRLLAIAPALAEEDGTPAALLGTLERLDKELGTTSNGLFHDLARDLAPGGAPGPIADRLHQAALALEAAAPPLLAALTHHLLPLVRARLERRKREAGLFDFQDMLTLVARSLEQDQPRAGELIAALRARYRYALVDEFQDTDETQWQIFHRLFFEASAPGVLTLVGDPKQAIYSFRGADVHTYLRARRELEAAQETLFLSASYRATPALIAAQNALLEQKDPAPFFRARGDIHYDHPVSCGQPTLALVDAAGTPAAPVVVFDVQRAAAAERPRLFFWEIKPALLERIGTEIARLLSDNGRLYLRRPERPPAAITARDIFVLTRTVRESREIGEALRARRIPFAYFKQERLFETIEARAVLDLLRALAAPEDRSARFRAFITPFFGLTLLDLAACDDLPADHPLMRRLDDWRALGDTGQIDQLFARILDESGVVSRELFDQGAKGRASERALTNYIHLFELLQREAAQNPGTLRELAQQLAGYLAGTRRQPDRHNGDVQRLETDADAVQIMTIHQSKGLEASVVFVYGATWPGPRGDVRLFHDGDGARAVRVGRQPEAEEALYLDDQEDEERRVFYVALTRARARLYLPRYPGKPTCSLNGAYRFVNERLHALLGGITPEPVRRLFQVEGVSCPHAIAAPHGEAALARAVADWQPPAALLAAPATDPAFREAVAARAGFRVTSYSAVRRQHGRFVPAEALEAGGDDASDLAATPGPAPARAPAAPDELPRGRLSGSFLHEVIERLPLETLARTPAFDDWRQLPEIIALFERMRRRHDRDPSHLGHAQRLVHTALTVPVRLGDVAIERGLGGAARPTREMEFLYPIPERYHPALARATIGTGTGRDTDGHAHGGGGGDGRAWRIERGVVKGFIDYLFEHEGRVYVCDWKSDALPSWDAAMLAAHCERGYAVQAQLYTLAAVRLLELDGAESFACRFGGVLYCFLRGMRAGDPEAGVYFRRPTWDEILDWQRAMLAPIYWGRA